jgi:hypothetical protein
MADLTDLEKQSLEEIAHPSLPEGSSIYGRTKVFPDYQAENGETYFTLVHGIAHESSVSFVAVLQATRAQRKGFESAIYFYGPGSLNCLATRGFPTTGSSAFPGEHNINNSRAAAKLGVPAALSVTALGRAERPVPGGGGRPGQKVRLTADVEGGWRPGYTGRQWDSTSWRRTSELRTMIDAVGRTQPAAAKDVSMAGIAGTLGMLAEASGCGAVLDVAAVPCPAGVSTGDWLTCFPGFAMLTADEPGAAALPAGPAVGAECGDLVPGRGVALRWPDGELTEAVGGGVTGLGQA